MFILIKFLQAYRDIIPWILIPLLKVEYQTRCACTKIRNGKNAFHFTIFQILQNSISPLLVSELRRKTWIRPCSDAIYHKFDISRK